MKFPPREDQRRVVLSHALVDVSGLVVTRAQARQVLDTLPEALIWRIWVLYRANLPPERYYTTGELYEAPDAIAHHQRMYREEQEAEAQADRAMAAVEQQFSPEDVAQERGLSRRLFEQAKAAGRIRPVTPE